MRSSTPASLPDLTSLEWRKEVKCNHFLIATSRDLINVDYVNKALASDEMPWARSMTSEEMTKMLDHSITICLYEETSLQPEAASTPAAGKTNALKQIGMARLITDHVTFAYLTDVYISPEYRRFGLARWLMTCCREVMASMTAIRRGMLVTGLSYGEAFYKETLGFYNVAEEAHHLVALTGKFKQDS